MGNPHEGHDLRRGTKSNLDGIEVWWFICVTCQIQGLTLEDVSAWPEFSLHDYYTNMQWCDPEIYEWYKESK
jgi:hypothetical protein